MINREHSVSWSTVIREQPTVRLNFREAFSYAQLHITLLIFLHKKPVDWPCLYNQDPTLFQHLNQICVFSDDHIFFFNIFHITLILFDPCIPFKNSRFIHSFYAILFRQHNTCFTANFSEFCTKFNINSLLCILINHCIKEIWEHTILICHSFDTTEATALKSLPV